MVKESNFNSNNPMRFVPIIEEQTPKVLARSKSGDIFNRLYQEKFRKNRECMENEIKRQALEMEECTFHPLTNRRNSAKSPDTGTLNR